MPWRLQNIFSPSDSCCELCVSASTHSFQISFRYFWLVTTLREIYTLHLNHQPAWHPAFNPDTSGPRVELTLECYTFTSLTFENGGPVGLPNHRVLQTHRAAAALFLRLVSIYVSHTHPATSGPWPGRAGADSPLGVVLAGLECEWLARVNECDVQDFPAQWAVWGEDTWGVNPELDQEVWLEGWSHPGVVQVWPDRDEWKRVCY